MINVLWEDQPGSLWCSESSLSFPLPFSTFLGQGKRWEQHLGKKCSLFWLFKESLCRISKILFSSGKHSWFPGQSRSQISPSGCWELHQRLPVVICWCVPEIVASRRSGGQGPKSEVWAELASSEPCPLGWQPAVSTMGLSPTMWLSFLSLPLLGGRKKVCVWEKVPENSFIEVEPKWNIIFICVDISRFLSSFCLNFHETMSDLFHLIWCPVLIKLWIAELPAFLIE